MSTKHTIILGGTKGIGLVLATTLASQGEEVTVLGRTAPTAALSALPTLQHQAADFAQSGSLTAALDTIKKTRPAPNHLVFFQRFRDDGDKWHGEMESSLQATRQTIEFFSEQFDPAADNSLVGVSSVVGEFVAADQPVGYHVAKAGLIQLMRYYAVVLGPKGVRANTVCPGTTVKPESADFYAKNTALNDLYRKVVPLARMGRAEDIVNVVRFLCSPMSSFVTGQTIFVDGGVSLRSQESLARNLTQL